MGDYELALQLERYELSTSALIDELHKINAGILDVVAGLDHVSRNLGTPLRSRLDLIAQLLRRQQSGPKPPLTEDAPQDVPAMAAS